MDQSDEYKDLQEAKRDGVIEKGWLPNILPASLKKLYLTTSVDTASGHGSFEFACDEYADFISRLMPYDNVKSAIPQQKRLVERLAGKGLSPLIYNTDSTSWNFICEQKVGECGCQFIVWQP